nr:nolG [Sinorhizobium meliloti]prf//1718309C nolG gene [Sinorhizobium meliloti]
MFLTRISYNHPVFATMMMVMILVLGLFSYGRLGVDHYPETDLPVVVVATTYTGASPESVEREISRPIEAALNTIGGIDTITSESYEGRSIVVVQFAVDVDSQDAAQEVRDRVARLETKFPDGVATPGNPLCCSVLDEPDAARNHHACHSRDQQSPERYIGRRQVSLIGSSERQVLVVVDPDRLGAYARCLHRHRSNPRRNQDRAAGRYIRASNQRIVTVEGALANTSGLQPASSVGSKKRLSRLLSEVGNHSRHKGGRSYQPWQTTKGQTTLGFAHR